MTANRPVVGLLVVVLLVWTIAFGGGYTVALFSATANASGTFESVDRFDPIEVDAALTEPDLRTAGSNDDTRDGSVESDSGAANGTTSGESGTDMESPDGNVTGPEAGEGNVTDSTSSAGNVTDEGSSDETSDLVTNGTDGNDDPIDESDPAEENDRVDGSGLTDESDSTDRSDPTGGNETTQGNTGGDGADASEGTETGDESEPDESEPDETVDGEILADGDAGDP